MFIKRFGLADDDYNKIGAIMSEDHGDTLIRYGNSKKYEGFLIGMLVGVLFVCIIEHFD